MILTRRQKELFNFIENYIEERGYSPTQREMSDHFNFAGNASVVRHLKALEEKGLIYKIPRADRGVELVKKRSIKKGSNEIPLIGTLLGDAPIESYKTLDFIDISKAMVRGLQLFAFIVKGDLLEIEHIKEGDYIIFETKKSADNGEIALIHAKGKNTFLRKVSKKADNYILQKFDKNREIEILPLNEVKIQGVYSGIIRSPYSLTEDIDETD